MVNTIFGKEKLKQIENTINNELEMKFDIKTIDHLGVQLYKSFPPVIAELVSNSYDAEAKHVKIYLDYEKNIATIEDDGHGMTLDEIKNQFLVIGRNRRLSENSGFSKTGKRKVTGKKGLGKLAVFGVTEEIVIKSTADGLYNSFSMNYSAIKNTTTQVYKPDVIDTNIKTKSRSGTVIELNKIRQKNITDMHTLAEGLSSRFQIFDVDFNVTIINVNNGEKIKVTNESFHNKINIEFEWDFPNDFSESINNSANLQWLQTKQVSGKIATNLTPLQETHRGFIIYARKKLVQKNTFFNDRSNDYFNSYVTGYFNTDFIDEDNNIDIISTDREAILWDLNEDLQRLKVSLNELITVISREWRFKRKEKNVKEIRETLPSDFYDDLPLLDKKMLLNVEKQMITDSKTHEDIKKSASLLKSIKQQLKFETFKNYVARMNDTEITIENMKKLSEDWEKIETNEMAKIAVGRIETIKKFEDYINGNHSETKVIQPFLEKFPWILEPRMTTFEREVTFSKILKESFPDDKLEESNRRIDFLCSNSNGNVVIIELKRPNVKITTNEVLQAIGYSTFLTEKRGNDITNVSTFLISNRLDLDRSTDSIYQSLKSDGKLIIKTYTELLDQAKEYHKHFIKLQEDIDNTKKETAD